ncbi:MAG: tannase/feruloyl esterase family alpha/beta hydrolase [Burkholderiales bacterium PBB5]|nr:MAG: tannase/feruloyl esterase family alpha/beta hydrolase [Burkholderiales bacterium PBB5]
MRLAHLPPLLGLSSALLLQACGGSDADPIVTPQLTAAKAGTLANCSTLAASLSLANTSITSSTEVAAGTLTVAGSPVAAHCLVTGQMYKRTSAVDGNSYAIGFEMRLPQAWNGRFFYQANGGIDGSVVTATGAVNGGAGLDNALNQGFAVISSDAGHAGSLGPFFGIDPQARLDYGYQAAAKLTPMAKSLITAAYGRGPDRSYFGGCSNGGRHTLVAASRLADQYDGFLAGAPGYNLPKAALDGATDGQVQDTTACQAAFNLERDVPTCTGARDGSCLSAAQKTGIAKLFAGATTSSGSRIYNSFPFDNGVQTANWAFWKFTAPLVLDSGGVGVIWQVPPIAAASFNGPVLALTGNLDAMVSGVQATNSTYTESAMSFMTPPNPSDLGTLKGRGAKLMIYHGTADAIFSADDSATYYNNLKAANAGDASGFARFYRVPGMNHCNGGPATDQFDLLSPLVKWVEQGVAPDNLVASVRGTGNPAGANADLPSSWSPVRTRPLCAYPQVARYNGSGSVELAANFSCR